MSRLLYQTTLLHQLQAGEIIVSTNCRGRNMGVEALLSPNMCF